MDSSVQTKASSRWRGVLQHDQQSCRQPRHLCLISMWSIWVSRMTLIRGRITYSRISIPSQHIVMSRCHNVTMSRCHDITLPCYAQEVVHLLTVSLLNCIWTEICWRVRWNYKQVASIRVVTVHFARTSKSHPHIADYRLGSSRVVQPQPFEWERQKR